MFVGKRSEGGSRSARRRRQERGASLCSPSARAVLEARTWRQELLLELLATDERLIFPHEIGTALDLTNFRRREWDRAVEAAGFEDFILRDVRHNAASALRGQGMDNKPAPR